MVSAPAAADAVRIARANPGLRVGLHLVVIEGPSMLGHAAIPDLVDSDGQFPSDQLALGINYFFRPDIRRQLEAEIRAQFDAFARTGLTLDHVNAHKHMHLHPTVGAMLLRIGRDYGLRRIRVPAEPSAVMQACGERVSCRREGAVRMDGSPAEAGEAGRGRDERSLLRTGMVRAHDGASGSPPAGQSSRR